MAREARQAGDLRRQVMGRHGAPGGVGARLAGRRPERLALVEVGPRPRRRTAPRSGRSSRCRRPARRGRRRSAAARATGRPLGGPLQRGQVARPRARRRRRQGRGEVFVGDRARRRCAPGTRRAASSRGAPATRARRAPVSARLSLRLAEERVDRDARCERPERGDGAHRRVDRPRKPRRPGARRGWSLSWPWDPPSGSVSARGRSDQPPRRRSKRGVGVEAVDEVDAQAGGRRVMGPQREHRLRHRHDPEADDGEHDQRPFERSRARAWRAACPPGASAGVCSAEIADRRRRPSRARCGASAPAARHPRAPAPAGRRRRRSGSRRARAPAATCPANPKTAATAA